ncbi:EpsG family protein [Vibrio alginolyticus]
MIGFFGSDSVYVFVLIVIIYVLFSIYLLSSQLSKFPQRLILLILYVLLFSPLFHYIASRDFGSDTVEYKDYYSRVGNLGFNEQNFEYLFFIYSKVLSLITSDVYFYFLIPCIFLFVGVFGVAIAASRGNRIYMILMPLIYSVYPFTYSLTTNVVRQSLAIGILFFIVFFIHSRVKDCQLENKVDILFSILLLLIASLFHSSAIICLILFIPYFFDLRFKSIALIYFICSILSVTGFSLINIAKIFIDGRYLTYIDGGLNNVEYALGFRTEFWLFSSFPFFLLLFINLYKVNIEKRMINFLKGMCLLGCLHFLTFTIPYNDRIGIYVWIFYPLYIAYLFDGALFKRRNI